MKKILNDDHLRGVEEVQLSMLFAQILAPDQYQANVKTKKESPDAVDFAIKLPGRTNDESNFVYLPIDAKFPRNAYEQLNTAYGYGVPDDIETASDNLELTIRQMARDISAKYLDPPNTTDFAIMFLPFESIYSEVIKRGALIDQLRQEFNVSVTGPTSLMGVLTSFQVAFKTPSIQLRSREVWNVLLAVKYEFDLFSGLLAQVQKRA